ncbi:MAG: hypothetical protein FD137_2417 [Spirochaetes bacterium]|nr:MAG: hypothetical protein FD137_2417 [Spirochaetota bacterium]
MKRSITVLIVLTAMVTTVWSQAPRNGTEYFGGLHRQGSQNIQLALGAGIPLFILPLDSSATESRPLDIGASFSLGYQYFVLNRLTLGGSLTGAFNTTVGGRTLFMAPISFRTAYWFDAESLELNLGVDLGFNVMRLSGNGVITPFAKLGGGAFVEVSEAWSVGGQLYWWLVPELHVGLQSGLTRYGNFLEISVGTVYHF